jgi:catechol 2,3-dioxygenase-like lactoylglutathione lyase family enzyme
MVRSVDRFFREYVDEFLKGNAAGRVVASALRDAGVGLMPLLDHCTLRTDDVDRRAGEVEAMGFVFDNAIGVLEFDTWWAKVYRKPGYPALFIDQAFAGARGSGSLIPQWVSAHGDRCFHHVGVLVEDIEIAMQRLQGKGVQFAGSIVGDQQSDLRQIFTQPEVRNGNAFTVLELVERRNGYPGFLPLQADGLMESSRIPT